jgi:hypothetical protein
MTEKVNYEILPACGRQAVVLRPPFRQKADRLNDEDKFGARGTEGANSELELADNN